MKYINYLLPAMLLLAFTSSCKKLADVAPTKFTTQPVAAQPIDTDLFIHSISFNAPTQYVYVSINGDKLTMVYKENVNLYIPKNGYALTYAIHLTENFDHSALLKYHFTTLNANGQLVNDWYDGNLNEIPSKTVSDTTIAGTAMVKINIQRDFTFSATYDNNSTAEDYILAQQNDKVEFTSYAFFTKNYPATDTSAPLVYIKAD